MFDFLNLKTTLSKFAGELSGVRAQIESLRQQREDLINAPATREDVKAMVEKWATGKAAQYVLRLQYNMTALITSPVNMQDDAVIESRMTLFGKSRQQGGEFTMFPGPELEDMAICCLMGPALIQSLMSAIDAMQNWPAGAVTLIGRAKKIKELDGTLAKLLQQEDSLVKSGVDAGVYFN